MIGYLRARRLKEIEEFKSKASVEKVVCDLQDELGESSNAEFNRLVANLSNEDTLVIKNLDNSCKSIYDICSIIETCRKNSVKLIFTDGNDSGKLLSDEGYSVLILIREFMTLLEKKSEGKDLKRGRKSLGYPDGFWDVYNGWKAGKYKDRDKFNSSDAAKELKIGVGTFYSLVKIFES